MKSGREPGTGRDTRHVCPHRPDGPQTRPQTGRAWFLARLHKRLTWPCRRVGWAVSRPQAAFPLAGGRSYLLYQGHRALPLRPQGEGTAATLPHSNKSGGEGGTQNRATTATLPGGGRARFGEGQTLPAGAYTKGARAYAKPRQWRSTGPQARSTGPSLPGPPPREGPIYGA